jgi:hypothetical protein
VLWKRTLNYIAVVGFEVLRAVVMKSSIFWDIMLCSPLKVNRGFGGTYRLNRQGPEISHARNQLQSRWQGWPLHGVISQKIVLYIAVVGQE